MKYVSPITVEAEIFLNSLASLSEQYNKVDIVLVSSLEKIMNAIENFLDSSPSEIVESKKTKLLKCDNISHINRIFTCSFCKRDIGKSVEKVALHLSEGCVNSKISSTAFCDMKKNEPNTTKSHSTLKKIKKNATTEGCKRNQDVKLTKKTHSLLTTNLIQFIDDQHKIGTKLKCIPCYDKIEKDLLSAVMPLFPNKSVQVYKFGSRIAGIGNRDSDLDLFLDIDDTFNIHQYRADDEYVQKLETVGKALKSHSKSWNGLMKITKARVPILKVIHNETGIECDINVSNSMGVINTKFLEYIFNMQPLAQVLCYFMKKWLSRTKLDDDMNTYSMNLMVLFFLQTLNLIPSVERLQENINQEKALKIGPWLCMYATCSLKDLNIQPVKVDQPNLLKYIRSFFNFYKHFNFSRDMICPYLGKVVKKDDLENSMPSRYIEYVERFPTYKLEMDKSITVQDPFQLNHNTCKSVKCLIFESWKQQISKSLEVLNDNFLDDI